MPTRLTCDALMIVIWNETENAFYDECGQHIENIYELITPDNIFLFRHNHGNCLFPMVDDRWILIEIIVEE